MTIINYSEDVANYLEELNKLLDIGATMIGIEFVNSDNRINSLGKKYIYYIDEDGRLTFSDLQSKTLEHYTDDISIRSIIYEELFNKTYFDISNSNSSIKSLLMKKEFFKLLSKYNNLLDRFYSTLFKFKLDKDDLYLLMENTYLRNQLVLLKPKEKELKDCLSYPEYDYLVFKSLENKDIIINLLDFRNDFLGLLYEILFNSVYSNKS